MADRETRPDRRSRRNAGLIVLEMTVYAMLGGMMYASKLIMEVLPSIHLLGLFVVVLTVVYRRRALYPIYVFVFLQGLFWGFAVWWIPYLYIWTVLWALIMLLPRRIPRRLAIPVYATVAALHGLAFSVLYAPVQALAYGYDLPMTLVWIAQGLPFDITQAINNFCFVAFLSQPLITLLTRLSRRIIT